MTAALEGGEWSAEHPGRILPPGKTPTHFTGGWVGPWAGLDRLPLGHNQNVLGAVFPEANLEGFESESFGENNPCICWQSKSLSVAKPAA